MLSKIEVIFPPGVDLMENLREVTFKPQYYPTPFPGSCMIPTLVV